MKNKNYLVFCICVFSCVIISCSDIQHNYYKDLYGLTDNQKMWLPDFLFESEEIQKAISDVFENHDIDTNEIWGSFRSSYNFSEVINKIETERFSINEEKFQKRFSKMNVFINNVKRRYYCSTKSFNIILYFDLENNLYFYYGRYK